MQVEFGIRQAVSIKKHSNPFQRNRLQIIEHILKAIRIHPNAVQNHAAHQPGRGTHPRSGQPDFQPTSWPARGIHDHDRSARSSMGKFPIEWTACSLTLTFLQTTVFLFLTCLRGGDELRIDINHDGKLMDRMSAKTNKGPSIDEITMVYP